MTTTTAPPIPDPSPLRHRDPCGDPRENMFISRSEWMLGCWTCRAAVRMALIKPVEPEQSTRRTSNYVCPLHYMPVTPKGRGCTRCAAGRNQPKKEHSNE